MRYSIVSENQILPAKYSKEGLFFEAKSAKEEAQIAYDTEAGHTLPEEEVETLKGQQEETVKAKKAVTVKKAIGRVTYAKASGNKKITVASNGKITVQKGLKRGKYKVKIKVTAEGNSKYLPLTKKITVTVVVK